MAETRVAVLCIKRIGLAGKKDIEILKNLPHVQEVISADYHFRVGTLEENERFLNALSPSQLNFYKENQEDPKHFIDKTCNELVDAYLEKTDAIFIPGAAVDTKAPVELFKPILPLQDDRRKQFELRLLERAKEKGIPVLSICAGAWRLAKSYGGKKVALDNHAQALHDKPKNIRELSERTEIIAGTMLYSIHNAAQANKSIQIENDNAKKELLVTPGKNKNFDSGHFKVNTLHRKALVPPSKQGNTPYDRLFETSAIDCTTQTVEAIESKFGVPMIGVQFHPEYAIPLFKKKDGTSEIVEDYKTHRGILESWVEAAQTYKNKKALLGDIKQLKNCAP